MPIERSNALGGGRLVRAGLFFGVVLVVVGLGGGTAEARPGWPSVVDRDTGQPVRGREALGRPSTVLLPAEGGVALTDEGVRRKLDRERRRDARWSDGRGRSGPR
jgi:hypothetical protein